MNTKTLGILLIIAGAVLALTFDHLVYVKEGKVFDFRNIPLSAIFGAIAIVVGIVLFFKKPISK